MNKAFVASFGQLFVLITLLHAGVAQPIDGSSPGEDSRKSIASVHTRPSDVEKVETKCAFPCTKHIDQVRLMSLRPRRSPFPSKPAQLPPSQPSAELQTIMSGNWQGMDPESLFKLLNTLATSKETLPEDFYTGYDDNEEDDPIDLVYSGKKPLLGSTTSSSNRQGAGSTSTLKGAHPLAEPISLMSSNMAKVYRFNDEDEDEAQPLQMHRLTKKYFPFAPTTVFKRSYYNNRKIWPAAVNSNAMMKDLVQLPSGKIAFTNPYEMHLLRYHQPILDQQLPLVRRAIL